MSSLCPPSFFIHQPTSECNLVDNIYLCWMSSVKVDFHSPLHSEGVNSFLGEGHIINCYMELNFHHYTLTFQYFAKSHAKKDLAH